MNQPAQQQDVPGVQSEMTPRPDCGEESYRGSGRLEGKSAVITGGDSGIGRAVAVAFAREGADVLISYLNESFGKDVPLGRPAQPAELAPVYVLLASDEGSYISGARIAVTGGNPIL